MDQTAPALTTVADHYLSALARNGIDYVFANAGTDFAPIIEGIVQAGDAGRAIPEFVTVPHENVAVAMAQGYYKVSGKPAGVMVHVTVGTANALCGLMNASRDKIPLLLAAGRTPNTETGFSGSRNVPIHWGQESFDQGGIVREYVKWDYELRSGQPVDALVDRALDIAMAEPRGPVYMTLPREVLGETSATTPAAGARRQPGVMAASPSAAAIERIADAIAAAERPLIITGGLRSSAAGVESLAALAADNALPVVQGMNANLPRSHPMALGGVSKPLFDWADLVVVIGALVPWIPRVAAPAATCPVIHIGADPLESRIPFRGYRTDLSVAGDPSAAIALLAEALASKGAGSGKAADARRTWVAERRAALDGARAKALAEARTMAPIHPAWVAHCLNEVKDRDAIFVNELGLPVEHLDFAEPGCLLGGGGSGGLGYGLGEALGAKIAARDRQVIAAVGDGSYIFNVPTAAHFVGCGYDLPTLTLVCNNAEWFAVRRATTGMYPEGRAAKSNTMPLVELTPSPNFEKTIEACGGRGERLDDPEKVHDALERALRDVDGGQSVLLNVICRAGGRG